MNKSIKEQLEEMWCRIPEERFEPDNEPFKTSPVGQEYLQDVKQLDNDLVSYFMTEMTQKEFDDRNRGQSKFEYEFNKIQEPCLKPTESSHNQVESVNGPWISDWDNEGLKRE